MNHIPSRFLGPTRRLTTLVVGLATLAVAIASASYSGAAPANPSPVGRPAASTLLALSKSSLARPALEVLRRGREPGD
ncbi:MAG: hypothetical protein ACYCUD_10775 [Candidatus Dormibacteria bacterium]